LPVTLPDDPAAVVVLDEEPFEGPLAALAQAAPSARHARLLVLGGDMPDLQAAVLWRLLTWSPGRHGACLVVDGWVQPLPMGLDRSLAAAVARELIEAGERSLRELVQRLDLEQIPEPEWRAIDPDARSLRDIDRPEDLAGPAD
jgi:molybdopterin-guanine dinucleotide biosynthesis protein A